MFGQWLTLPRDGPDLLCALPPVATSASVDPPRSDRVVRGLPPAPCSGPHETAPRARMRRRLPLPDRQLAVGLHCPSHRDEPDTSLNEPTT
jgi:hypothetical protein